MTAMQWTTNMLLLFSLLDGSICAVDFCKRDLSTLQQLIVLFRHGDRNPIGTFPTDYYNEKSWPNGMGALTPTGDKQQFANGQWTSSCYGVFLNKTQRVEVKSTNHSRTLGSAQEFLSGVYFPKEYQANNFSIGNRKLPFPIYTITEEEGHVIYPEKQCPRYNELVQAAYNASGVRKQEEALLRYLGEKSGLNTSDFFTITGRLADPAVTEFRINRQMVPWLQNVTVIDKLKTYLNIWAQLSYNGSPEIAKISGGLLLQNIVDQVISRSTTNSLNTPPSYDFIVLSGHDATVAGVLSSLGDFNNIFPPYASTVIFELHKTTKNSFGILVYYRNTTDRDPYPVRVPLCSGFMETGCLLNDFLKAVSTKVSRNHNADCHSWRPVPPKKRPMRLFTIFCAVAGFGIITGSVFLYLRHQRRDGTTYQVLRS